jgi:ionotropic kainate glutamate receptor 2
MYDSVYALARGLQSLERGATLRPVNVSCDEENPWNDGSSLFNYVNAVRLNYIPLIPFQCHSNN